MPSLVLYALAIELGFKTLALHASGSPPKKVHNSKALYRRLPAEIQTDIVRSTSNSDPALERTFDRDLAIVADVFEVWRYIHEQNAVDTYLGFLQRLARAVEFALLALP